MHKIIEEMKILKTSADIEGNILTVDEMQQEICEQMIQFDIASISIEVGTPVFIKTVRSEKTSFAEQLATVGNIFFNLYNFAFISYIFVKVEQLVYLLE